MNREKQQEISEEFDKLAKHKPSWPVVGGARVCAKCGEENYETECCSITIDWTIENIKDFFFTTIDKVLADKVKEIEALKEDYRDKNFDEQNLTIMFNSGLARAIEIIRK